MTYVMSDLHGQYELYRKMLAVIGFSSKDELFVLGDVIDRGKGGLDILKDMSMRPNVFPIMGNHEHMAEFVLHMLNAEITSENYSNRISPEGLILMSDWLSSGGEVTLDDFHALPLDEREDILSYIEEFSPYDVLEVGGKTFVLVHGGLPDFAPDKDLDDYDQVDMLYTVTDYHRVYFPDKYLVTGHIPTCTISPIYDGQIYIKNNHIALDCGAGHGKPLGCIRLDDMETFYVKP